ncbi:MAG: hypothetical protein R3C03_19540 [Pirellulaceae bacterium]
MDTMSFYSRSTFSAMKISVAKSILFCFALICSGSLYAQNSLSNIRSNLYSAPLAPLPSKNQPHPASILNYVSPPTKQVSDRQEEISLTPGRKQSEVIDDLINGDRVQNEGRLNEDVFPQGLSTRPASRGAEVVRQRYPDGSVQLEREVIQDEVGNYLNHGPWRLYNRSGQPIASGLFDNGLMEGEWNRLHGTGEEGIFSTQPFDSFQAPYFSTATFSAGKLSGYWQIYDRNRRKIMEIQYSDGQRNGSAIWWFPNGVKMREMTFRDGIIDGMFVERSPQNQTTRQEEYVEGRKVSVDTAFYEPDRKRAESTYLEAKLVPDGHDDWWTAKPAGYKNEGVRTQEGPVASWFQNGQLEMRGQFVNGERDGDFIVWHPNGQKKLVGLFKAGERVGIWTWWHANGLKASEGRFENDNPIGAWVSWDENGKVSEKKEFSNESKLPSPNNQIEGGSSRDSEAEAREEVDLDTPPDLGGDTGENTGSDVGDDIRPANKNDNPLLTPQQNLIRVHPIPTNQQIPNLKPMNRKIRFQMTSSICCSSPLVQATTSSTLDSPSTLAQSK